MVVERGLGGAMGERWLPPLGTRLGRYQLERVLGQGGMGAVYAARDLELGREVAIKVLLPSLVEDPELLERFRREGQALAALSHPNVLRIHEVGSQPTPSGPPMPYLVLEYVQGESLQARLKEQGPLEPPEAAALMRSLVDALQEAHAKGVLHRDLKPGNVLLTRYSGAKLADFGLARLVDQEALTVTGQLLGTPAYMAPEQAAGERQRYGPATDVYGLGAVLYACLTGKAPFDDSQGRVAQLHSVLFRPPKRPTVVRPGLKAGELETICLVCLEKEPQDRYASMEALAADLDCWSRGESIHAELPGPGLRMRRWAGRHRWVVALAGVAVVAIASAAGYALQRYVLRAPEPVAVVEEDPLEPARAAALEGRPRDVIALLSALPELSEAGQALLQRAYDDFARPLEKPTTWAAASAALGSAIAIRPTPDLHERCGQALDRQLRLAEASKHYGAAADLLGLEPPADEQQRGAWALRRARLWLLAGKDGEARAASREAVEALRDRSEKTSRTLLGEVHLFQARLEVDHGEVDQALARLDEADRLLEEDYRVPLWRGIAKREREPLFQEIKDFKEAARRARGPARDVVRLHQLLLLIYRRHPDEAKKLLEDLEDRDQALSHVAMAWQKLDHPAVMALWERIAADGSLANATEQERQAARPVLVEAEGWLDQALERDPRSGRAWMGRGMVRMYLGRQAEAESDAKVGAGLRPALPMFWFYRACVLTQGDKRKALKCALVSLKKRDTFHLARWLCMSMRTRLGDLDGAREDAGRLFGLFHAWLGSVIDPVSPGPRYVSPVQMHYLLGFVDDLRQLDMGREAGSILSRLETVAGSQGGFSPQILQRLEATRERLDGR
jgi:hypothetical protein